MLSMKMGRPTEGGGQAWRFPGAHEFRGPISHTRGKNEGVP